MAIFSKILLRMCRNGYLWTTGVNSDTIVWFPDLISYTVRNFCDLVTFSIHFYISYAESLPYFYFQFVWPTDLESMPHASTLLAIILTKFDVDRTIHSRVIAFLLLISYLTLSSCHTWRVTWPTLPPSLKTLRLFVLQLWVIMFPTGYFENAYEATACAESHFWNPRHQSVYSLYNFGGSMIKVIQVFCQNNARPCVKSCISFCARAKSSDLLKAP